MPAPIPISGQIYEKTGLIVASPGCGACLGISGVKVGKKPKSLVNGLKVSYPHQMWISRPDRWKALVLQAKNLPSLLWESVSITTRAA
jgi:hypothetical protein